MTFETQSPNAPDAAALLDAYAEETARRVSGWTAGETGGAPQALAAHGLQMVVAYDPAGRAVACGGLWLIDAERAELKRMFVRPEARGQGIARALLVELERLARSLGARQVVLDTAASLSEARALYASAGYEAIARYNDNPFCTHWFGKEVG